MAISIFPWVEPRVELELSISIALHVSLRKRCRHIFHENTVGKHYRWTDFIRLERRSKEA